MPPTAPVMVPAPYLDADSARTLLIFALVASVVLVLLWLAALGCWLGLRAGWRNWQAMRADTEWDTQELPAVVDPIAQHADRVGDWAGPTYRYPCVTDAEWDTAVHHFYADYDVWEASQ